MPNHQSIDDFDKNDIKKPDQKSVDTGFRFLTEYRRHGSGVDLFEAYMARRNADRDMSRNRMETLLHLRTHQYEEINGEYYSISPEAERELLLLLILQAMDPVISDILRFCKALGNSNDQLSNLRSALRIGRGNAPDDRNRINTKQEIQGRWLKFYVGMYETKKYESDRSFARKIANEFDLSIRTVINYWKEHQEESPILKSLTESAIRDAKPHKTSIVTRKEKKVRVARKKITFGQTR